MTRNVEMMINILDKMQSSIKKSIKQSFNQNLDIKLIKCVGKEQDNMQSLQMYIVWYSFTQHNISL